MRITQLDELMEGFKSHGIPHEPYYWYVAAIERRD